MNLEFVRFRLAELKEAGWTQWDISHGSGLSQATVSKLSTGKTSRITKDTSIKLENFFKRKDVMEVLQADALSEDDARKAIRLFKFFRTEIQAGAQVLLRTPDQEDRFLVILL